MINKPTLIEKLNNISDYRTWKSSYKEEHIALIEFTNFLPTNASLRQRIWHLLNNKNSVLLCSNIENCTEIVKWNTTTHKYQQFCSNKCTHQGGNLLQKREETNLQKYGHTNFFGSIEGKQKIKERIFDIYGVNHPLKSEEIVNKLKATNQKKYGTNSFLSTSEGKEIRAKAIQEKGGQIILNKKISETKQLKYSKFEEWKTNIRDLDKKEFDNDTLYNIFKSINDPIWLTNEHKTKSLTQIANDLNIGQPTISSKFKKYELTVTFNKSRPQNEIIEFIKQNCDHKIIINTKNIIKPYELDIYIPDLNLAIELDGIFWHSFISKKQRTYHLMKTIKCNAQSIRCIHIFDQEWDNQRQLVQSKILHSINKTPIRIHARKCIIKEVPSKIIDEFLNTNHLQGKINSKIHHGLYYNDELVSVICFKKPRYTKNYDYELLRFCCKLNTIVIGGANKLFNYFIQQYNPKTIISYCDLRWGTGNLYNQLGFVFDKNSKPNYYYFKRTPYNPTLFSRIQFQKHKLKDKLQIFDPNLSEWQNMINNGYDKIYDCGNSVWIWSNPNLT